MKFNRWTKNMLGGWWGNIWQCNVDVAVAKKQSTCTWERHGGKKLFLAGWGLLIGGCVFLFVGGIALKGGSLSELPKTAFFNKILITNWSFGRWFFFRKFLLLWSSWIIWGFPAWQIPLEDELADIFDPNRPMSSLFFSLSTVLLIINHQIHFQFSFCVG